MNLRKTNGKTIKPVFLVVGIEKGRHLLPSFIHHDYFLERVEFL